MCKNRRWIESVLEHQEQHAIPFNFDFSPPARILVEEHYGKGPIEEKLDFPVRTTGLQTIKPLYASPDIYGDKLKDEFGVLWSTTRIDRGSPIGPSLVQPDFKGYVFPDPKVVYRFEKIGDWCERNQRNFRVIWSGDLWERATFMRGMEQILLDLVLHPEFVEQLLRNLTDYLLETITILVQRFEFEAIAISDDYGTQRALIMSPQMWRRFIKPLLTEVYDLAHANNKKVFQHSCGNVEEIIPDLIEIGMDILHPIQPETMDVFRLKREFGQDLCFCGGLRTQDLLPCGGVQDIRDEVRRLKEYLGRDGGYILEPGITLQADIPLENLVAMMDEAINGD